VYVSATHITDSGTGQPTLNIPGLFAASCLQLKDKTQVSISGIYKLQLVSHPILSLIMELIDVESMFLIIFFFKNFWLILTFSI